MGGRAKTARTIAVGAALGIVLAIAVPAGREKLRIWIGQIVLDAVHQHWEFEQGQVNGIMQMLVSPGARPEA